MAHSVVVAIAKTFRGIARAIQAPPKTFWGVAAGVFVFNLAVPVIILSLAQPLERGKHKG